MSKVIEFDKDGQKHVGCAPLNQDCYPVYDPGCESTGPECCPTRCRPDPCPPFRARDAIRIREFEVERLFDLRSYCGDRPFYAVQRCVRLDLKCASACNWEWSTAPLSVTHDGKLRFRWPTEFLRANPGYYHARLVVDDQPVKHIPFYKPFAKVNIHSTEAVEEDYCSGCHEPWSTCCCERPEVEQEPCLLDNKDCGGCNDRCD